MVAQENTSLADIQWEWTTSTSVQEGAQAVWGIKQHFVKSCYLDRSIWPVKCSVDHTGASQSVQFTILNSQQIQIRTDSPNRQSQTDIEQCFTMLGKTNILKLQYGQVGWKSDIAKLAKSFLQCAYMLSMNRLKYWSLAGIMFTILSISV